MATNTVAVYVGLALIVFGAVAWLFLSVRDIGAKTDATRGDDDSIVIVGLGFRVSTKAPAIAIMGIGVVVVLASKLLPDGIQNITREPDLVFKEYHSDALGVTFKFPLGVLVLDDTKREQLRLFLRDTKGQAMVKILRSKPADTTDLKQAQERESTLLVDRGYTITYKAPEKEWGNWYVLSGVLNDNIFYYKRWYLKDNVLSIEFEYPREMSSIFESTINVTTRDMTFAQSIPTSGP